MVHIAQGTRSLKPDREPMSETESSTTDVMSCQLWEPSSWDGDGVGVGEKGRCRLYAGNSSLSFVLTGYRKKLWLLLSIEADQQGDRETDETDQRRCPLRDVKYHDQRKRKPAGILRNRLSGT